jgi:amidase
MRIDEYAALDGIAIAELIAAGTVSIDEVGSAAYAAIEALNPTLGAVVETLPPDHPALVDLPLPGPLHGAPFLVKDLGPHFAGLHYEWASRLCAGLVAERDDNFGRLVKQSGVRIVGRSATPEFSLASCGDSILHGPCRNPWDPERATYGSSGGAAAAVAAGLVPIAHASDIGGSTRGPAGWCGAVGLQPSRGRVSAGPDEAESGYGMAQSNCITRTVRDTAQFLDCVGVPQPGDPFVIPAPPAGTFREHARGSRQRYRIGWSADPLMDAPVDPETAAAVEAVAQTLADLGHDVVHAAPTIDLEALDQVSLDIWYFQFDGWLDELGAMTGRRPGPDTLEAGTLRFYEHAKTVSFDRFLEGLSELNRAARLMGPFFAAHDVWLSPTTAQPAQLRGAYSMDVDLPPHEFLRREQTIAQFLVPYNAAGLPAISLPLAQHSSGLPIGIQLGAGSACEHVLLELAADLEQALPWRDRRPGLHVGAPRNGDADGPRLT